MNLISTSWSCARCGAAYMSTRPEHGLCDQCVSELEALARLVVPAPQPCPACGGPVCADCGKALILLTPTGAGLLQPSQEVISDDS